MTTGAAIRSARADEADAVLEVWRRSGSARSATDDAEHVRALIAHADAALLVAELGGRLAGTLVAAWDGWRGHLYRLAVLPELRRRGIALALVRAGEDFLGARGAVRLSAIVIEEHAHAVGFWRAAGYDPATGQARFTRNLEARRRRP